MVGLNHELASELLWREFPSDTRAHVLPQLLGLARHRRRRCRSCPPIHDVESGGRRSATSFGAGATHVVLLIRGELLHRYPDALIYAVKAKTLEGARHRGEAAALPRADRPGHHVPRLRPDRGGGARRRDRPGLVLRDPGAADRAALRAGRRRAAARSTPGTTSPGATSAPRPARTSKLARRPARRSRARAASRGRSTARTWPPSCASARCGSRSTRGGCSRRPPPPQRRRQRSDEDDRRRSDARRRAARRRRCRSRCSPCRCRRATSRAAASRSCSSASTPTSCTSTRHEPRLTAAEVAWGKKAWQLAWPQKARHGRGAARVDAARRALRRAARRVDRAQAPADEPEGAAEDAARRSPLRARCAPRDDRAARARAAAARPLGRARLPGPDSACCSRRARRSRATLPVGPTFDDEPLPDVGPGRAAARRGHALARRLRRGREGRDGDPRRAHARAREPGRSTRCSCFGVNATLAPGRGRDRARGAARRAALHARARLRRARHADEQHDRGGTGFSAPRPHRGRRASRASPVAAKTGLGRRGRRPTARHHGPRCSPASRSAARTDDLDARHLQTALWPVTGGYYLDQIMALARGPAGDVHDAQLDAGAPLLHRLRPRARPAADAPRRPPAVRPAARRPRSTSSRPRAREGASSRRLRFLRGAWRGRARPGVPRLAPTATRTRSSRSCACSRVGRLPARLAFDGQFFAPTPVFSSPLSAHLQSHAQRAPRAAAGRASAAGLVGAGALLRPDPGRQRASGSAAPLVTRGDEQPGAAARAELHLVPAHGELRRPHQRALPGRLPAGGAARRAPLPPAAPLGPARVRRRRAAHPRPQGACYRARTTASRRSWTSSAARCRSRR